MFSLQQYEDVSEAYISGVEALVNNGGDPSRVASVASFFVSRVDVMVDEMLQEKDNTDLLGTIGIANARVAYARFCEVFGSDRWQALADKGAQVQRPLWASTSVKNDDYPDTLYVDELLSEQTVNTLPPDTFDALLDHGNTEIATTCDASEARKTLEQLDAAGIDLDDVTDKLLEEGIEKFQTPFDALIAAVDEKSKRMAAS